MFDITDELVGCGCWFDRLWEVLLGCDILLDVLLDCGILAGCDTLGRFDTGSMFSLRFLSTSLFCVGRTLLALVRLKLVLCWERTFEFNGLVFSCLMGDLGRVVFILGSFMGVFNGGTLVVDGNDGVFILPT